MKIQIWLVMNILPAFSAEDKKLYEGSDEAQFTQCGYVKDGRILVRCITEEGSSLVSFLAEKGKDPYVVAACDSEGNLLEAYNANKTEYDRFFQPPEMIVGLNGSPIESIPAQNTCAGWELPKWDIIR